MDNMNSEGYFDTGPNDGSGQVEAISMIDYSTITSSSVSS